MLHVQVLQELRPQHHLKEVIPAQVSLTSGFGVMGYQMTNDWANNQTTTAPNFMYNEQITWDANGYWKYDPVKYWPNGNEG